MATKVSHNELVDFKQKQVRGNGGFSAIWSLFNTYWWRSGMGPFFTFAFPVLIYAILGSLMDAKLMFGGIVAMTTMSIGVQGLPWSIMELKQSVLLKRIGASPVKTYQFTLAIVAHTVTMMLISVFWLMLWVLIIFQDPTIFEPLKQFTSFAGFMYGVIMAVVLSVAIGFALSAVSKTETQASMYGMLIYFPATFLSGQFISIDIIAASPFMNWISILTPFRYPTMFIINAWTFPDANAFAIQDVTWPTAVTIEELREAIADGKLGAVDFDYLNINSIDDLFTYMEGPEGSWLAESYSDGEFFLNSQTLYTSNQIIVGHLYPLTFCVACTAFSAKVFKWSGAR